MRRRRRRRRSNNEKRGEAAAAAAEWGGRRRDGGGTTKKKRGHATVRLHSLPLSLLPSFLQLIPSSPPPSSFPASLPPSFLQLIPSSLPPFPSHHRPASPFPEDVWKAMLPPSSLPSSLSSRRRAPSRLATLDREEEEEEEEEEGMEGGMEDEDEDDDVAALASLLDEEDLVDNEEDEEEDEEEREGGGGGEFDLDDRLMPPLEVGGGEEDVRREGGREGRTSVIDNRAKVIEEVGGEVKGAVPKDDLSSILTDGVEGLREGGREGGREDADEFQYAFLSAVLVPSFLLFPLPPSLPPYPFCPSSLHSPPTIQGDGLNRITEGGVQITKPSFQPLLLVHKRNQGLEKLRTDQHPDDKINIARDGCRPAEDRGQIPRV